MKRFVLILVLSLTTISSFSQTYTLQELRADLQNLAFYLPANVGISFISDHNDTVNINADRPFPLMSVMKFHQALAICNTMNKATLDSTLSINESELNPKTYSPLLKTHPHGGSFTIRQLLNLSLVESDNNASNILYNRLINVHAVNTLTHEYLNESDTSCGFHILYSEETMGMDVNLARANFSTPLAATRLMQFFYEHRNSSSTNKYLWQTMSQCKTGQYRIPRYITDRKVTIVHKTGTGGTLPDGTIFAVNDVACILLPNGRYCFLSVFISDAHCEIPLCEEFIANVAKIIYDFMTE